MDDFKQIFFSECSELLLDMEDRLIKLEEGVYDKDALNAIFRCAHSIKGGSGAVGLNAVMNFTHSLEALLDEMREGKILPSRQSIDTLLKSADIVTKMLDAAKEGKDTPAGFETAVLNDLQNHIRGGGRVLSAAPVAAVKTESRKEEYLYNISFTPHEEIFNTGNDPLLIIRELGRLGEAEVKADISKVESFELLNPLNCKISWNIELQTTSSEADINEVFEFVQDVSDVKITKEIKISEEVPAEVIETKIEAVAPPVKKSDEAAATKASGGASIRVDLEKVDRLVNMVGELVITEAMLCAQAKDLAPEKFAGLLKGIDELSHHTRELQEAVMSVRMQPVKSIFSRMPRIVRDTAGQLGKDIQLVLSGENTEVDKTVIELLGDPLTHMIRNAVDHGIEKPDERAWNDKPLQGTIHLSAYHKSGRIIIQIEDDGAGIKRERVLNKAKEKGLVAQDATLTDEEIDHLIFMPGFSTAESVSSISGRGVGMDVVRRNIESLDGTVRITNMPGKGSIFTVSLPLTLAILDGMIVRVGAENYIIPITSIIETLRPKKEDVHRVEGRGDVINVREEFIPLNYLHKIFNIKDAVHNPNEALVVLVESGDQKMGLVVDELIGQQQVVIKSLEANADPVKGISGATILGDGKVSLILEIDELRQLCSKNYKNFSNTKAA